MSEQREKPARPRAVHMNPWVLAQAVAQAQQPPRPVRIVPNVRQAVAVGFPEDDRAAALAVLRRYRGPETPRVHRAVLVLSKCTLAGLERMIDAANEDYRDVLYWAEYPEESTTGGEAEKRRAVEAMAARWRKLGLRAPTPDG